MTVKPNQTFFLAFLLIVFAAITRFIPHPFNFTAIGAIALFSGANFSDKRFAFLLPIFVLLITDMILGLHASMIPVYLCFSFTVWLGTAIKNKQRVLTVIGASIFGSLAFYLVTNLPFWYMDIKLYPATIQGTMLSYTNAIPFFKNQILGDLFYNGLLFSLYHSLVNKKIIIFAEKTQFISKK